MAITAYKFCIDRLGKHGDWNKIYNSPRNAQNEVCMQNLHPHGVGVSTRLLRAHIPFATSSPRVRILDFRVLDFKLKGSFESCDGLFVNKHSQHISS